MTELLSVRAYARHRKDLGLTGGTHRAVQKAIADGRLEGSVRIVNGKPAVDPVAADVEWAQKTDTLRSNRGGDPTTGRPLGGLEDEHRVDARNLDGSGSSDVASQARAAQAVRLTYQAKLAELEYRQKVGELVSAEDVALAQTRCARSLRDRIRAIPDRLAAMLAAETDPHRCRIILQGELDQALGDVARELREAARSAAS